MQHATSIRNVTINNIHVYLYKTYVSRYIQNNKSAKFNHYNVNNIIILITIHMTTDMKMYHNYL